MGKESASRVYAALAVLAFLSGTGFTCPAKDPVARLAAYMSSMQGGAFDASSAPTKSRLSDAQFADLTAQPAAELQAGDIEKAKADFEVLLQSREGPDHESQVRYGDTLESFGVAMFMADQKEASLAYLERGISAFRRAFGPRHPEVAVALNSWADAAKEISPESPPTGTDEAYEEAYEIRLASLGPSDPETLSNLVELANLKGLPARTNGDPAKVQTAANLFEQLIEALKQNPRSTPSNFGLVYSELSVMYAKNGDAKNAASNFDLAVRAVGQLPDGEPKEYLALDRVTEALIATGHRSEAEALTAKYASCA